MHNHYIRIIHTYVRTYVSSPASEEQYCFLLKDLLQASSTGDDMMCPIHKGSVKLDLLV